jgi:hypothetical protein
MTTPLPAGNAATESPATRRSRVRLDTRERVRREVARLYVDGRDGRRDPHDVSELASALAVIGFLVGADRP